MNEQIKQLAEQSGFGWALKRASLYGHDDDKQNLENFAELIIRECLKEIKDMIVDESERLYPNNKQTTEFVNDRLLDAYDNIKEHFGIEE